MSAEKRHLSHTQLELLSKCGLAWEFRYVKGIKSPPGVALVVGKGTHGAIEKDLGRKLEWGELLPDDAIADFAADATRTEWEKDPPKPDEDGSPADLGGAVDMAVALAELHHKALAPDINPIAVERRFLLELPGFPFDIEGQIDIEEEGVIRDTKTASKAPSTDAADRSDQLTLYAMEAASRGAAPSRLVLDHLVKTKTPKVVSMETTRTADDHNRLLRKVEAAAKVIESGAFLPAPKVPGVWWCSSRFCGYWESHCPFGARNAVSVGLIDPSRLRSRNLPPRSQGTP